MSQSHAAVSLNAGHPPRTPLVLHVRLNGTAGAAAVNRDNGGRSRRVGGGMLLLNLTEHAPVPSSGDVLLKLPAGCHRISLVHPEFHFDDLVAHVYPGLPNSAPVVVTSNSLSLPLDVFDVRSGSTLLLPALAEDTVLDQSASYKYAGSHKGMSDDPAAASSFNYMARGQRVYVIPSPGFQIQSILYNPMILMALVMIVMAAVMPKLSKMLEEEQQAGKELESEKLSIEDKKQTLKKKNKSTKRSEKKGSLSKKRQNSSDFENPDNENRTDDDDIEGTNDSDAEEEECIAELGDKPRSKLISFFDKKSVSKKKTM